ncbi:unnamed protein product, partial [Meganyctiphanes norvegica]
MMSRLLSRRLCQETLKSLAKNNYRQLIYDDKVFCSSLLMNIRYLHPQKRIHLHTIKENSIKISTPFIVRQFANAPDPPPPLKKAGILGKILKISLGSVIALLTTGGLLIAKTVYEDEEDPVSPENMTAPSRRSDINKEWVEFMLTDYENRQKSGTKVTVNNFEVGD